MKREEAIKLIDTHTVCFYNEIDSPTLQALHLAIEALSAEAVQGWNNHEIACMLADLFKDPCACNQCCIDEWLPYKCDLDCGNVVGVACWEQFVTHYREHKGGDSE